MNSKQKTGVIRVLFVCIHNSARSQMAEGFLNALGKDDFQGESAGLEPGKLNPDVVKVMAQAGVDISHHTTQSVFDLVKKAREENFGFDYIITVCDKEAAERCPIFPNTGNSDSTPPKRIHWSFPDPSLISKDQNLSVEDRLQKIGLIRDEIKASISEFINSNQ